MSTMNFLLQLADGKAIPAEILRRLVSDRLANTDGTLTDWGKERVEQDRKFRSGDYCFGCGTPGCKGECHDEFIDN